MIIGMYYLSAVKEGAVGEGRAFSNVDEAVMAYENGDLDLHAWIKVRVGWLAGEAELHAKLKPMLKELIDDKPVSSGGLTETTVGRAILNGAFPPGFPYVNAVLIKSDVRTLVEEVIHTQTLRTRSTTSRNSASTLQQRPVSRSVCRTSRLPLKRSRYWPRSRIGLPRSRACTRKASSPTTSVDLS